MLKKISFILIALFATAFFYTDMASADISCPNVYGANCPVGNLILDKKVRNPKTGELVDALSANSSNFLAGQEVNFRIEVKNTGSAEINNISVQDILPEFVDFISGPGNFDKGSRKLSWGIDKLSGGESKFFDIKVKVKSGKDLPSMDISCVTNFAEAKKDNMVSQDTATFCIQTKVLGVTKELPKTGFGNTEKTLLISVLMLTASGYLLKRFKTV